MSAAPALSSPWPPRWLSNPDYARTRGRYVADVAESLCRLKDDTIAGHRGDLMVLRPWQRLLLDYVFSETPDGRLRFRRCLVGMARKNAKSTLSAPIAIDALLFGPEGGQIVSAAAEKEQARLIHSTAKFMIESDPELSAELKVYRDAIVCERTGSTYRVISAEAYSKEGLNLSLVIADELHAWKSRDLFDVLSLASGAREEPLFLAVTTAGAMYDSSGQESICYQLYRHGRDVCSGEVDDPAFGFAWWESAADAPYRDPASWVDGNPGLGDLLSVESLQVDLSVTPEAEFKTKHMNVWTAGTSAWLPDGAWASCEHATMTFPPNGVDVVLGFDGGYSGDSTALVGCTLTEPRHLFLVELWESPSDDPDWTIDPLDVEHAIRKACKRWRVREIAADPYRWQRSLGVLERERLPVVEFPQNASRMGPATTAFYEAVTSGKVTHDGDPRLARHLGNAVLIRSGEVYRVGKERKNSPRKVDAAIAAVMAHSRALDLKPRRRNYF